MKLNRPLVLMLLGLGVVSLLTPAGCWAAALPTQATPQLPGASIWVSGQAAGDEEEIPPECDPDAGDCSLPTTLSD